MAVFPLDLDMASEFCSMQALGNETVVTSGSRINMGGELGSSLLLYCMSFHDAFILFQR